MSTNTFFTVGRFVCLWKFHCPTPYDFGPKSLALKLWSWNLGLKLWSWNFGLKLGSWNFGDLFANCSCPISLCKPVHHLQSLDLLRGRSSWKPNTFLNLCFGSQIHFEIFVLEAKYILNYMSWKPNTFLNICLGSQEHF